MALQGLWGYAVGPGGVGPPGRLVCPVDCMGAQSDWDFEGLRLFACWAKNMAGCGAVLSWPAFLFCDMWAMMAFLWDRTFGPHGHG